MTRMNIEQLLISVVTLTTELLLIMVEAFHCIKGPHLVWWDRCDKCVLNESYADGDGDGDGDGECIKGPYLVGWDRCNESYANADDDDYIDFDG